MEKKRTAKNRFGCCFFLLFFVCIFFFGRPVFPGEKEDFLRVSWSPERVPQGDICVVTVLAAEGVNALTGDFQGRGLLFNEEEKKGTSHALIGVDMEAHAGVFQLRVLAKDSSGDSIESKHEIEIVEKSFETQRLTLRKEMVELKKETLSRVEKEKRSTDKIWPQETKDRMWHGEFIKPIHGEISGTFGLRRILNNSPKSPHSGIDLKAKMGDEILSSNAGVVVLADELYFSGKSVVVDHGQGLYTMYFHLSRIEVEEGQRLEKGKALGLAGSSGRATGPHLHFGVRLNGARVDPLSLFQLK